MSKSNSKLIQEVILDYNKRREARRSLEAQWQLNVNFIMGNQYSYIASNGGIKEDEKQYFWQEKEVFNHIAPIVETRISKICSNTPNVMVMPSSTDEADVESAKLSKEILNSVSNRLNLIDIEKTATTWSEICGTVFYKVVWNTNSGKMVATDELGNAIKEGDVEVEVVSPFEIFPDNISCERMEDVKSIIHARAMDVDGSISEIVKNDEQLIRVENNAPITEVKETEIVKELDTMDIGTNQNNIETNETGVETPTCCNIVNN